MPFPARRRYLLRIAAALCAFAVTVSAIHAQTPSVRPTTRIVAPIDSTRRTILHGNVHPLATAANDAGPVDDATPMRRMILTFAPSEAQQQALDALVLQQQDKNSPEFHHWLTPAQFGAQFGISDSDLAAITAWLTGQGFTIDRIAAARTSLQFSGTAGQVERAFATTIHHYRVNSVLYQANATDPSIPAALAPVVRGIVSLHNFPRRPHHEFVGNFRRDRATGKLSRLPTTTTTSTTRAQPHFTYPDPNYNQTDYAVGPYDFATIYNVAPLWNAGIDGAGETIAIVGETNIHLDDVRAFRSLFDLPANDPQIILDGTDPGITAYDEGEADIDVEWSGAVAKNATIKFVASASTETTAGIDLSAEYIIDNNLAPIMSESYGECELGLGTTGNAFYKNLWEQAAAQGISVFISTGDNGSAGCDNPDGTTPAEYGVQVSGIASTPYNTAVGGTDFLGTILAPNTYWSPTNNPTTLASALSYIPETTWNSTCANLLLQTSLFWSQSSTAAACQYASRNGIDLFVPVGGSGGVSACTTPSGDTPATCSGGYAKPSWQSGLGVPADSKRDIPDVALFAASGFFGSFYSFCDQDLNTDSESCNANSPYADIGGVGGTSVSTPAFAGIMALVNQATGERQGLANPVLYSLFSNQVAARTSCATGYNTSSGQLLTPSSSCVFNDLTYGSNAVPCTKGSTNCTTPNGDEYGILTVSGTDAYRNAAGYDLASGLGSVNAYNLVRSWETVALLPTATSLSLSTTTFTHGAAVNATVGVTPQSGTGTPTGNVSLLTSTSPVSVGSLTLSGGAATAAFNNLPGGSYTVSAHYAGDSTYAASDSTPVAVTVIPENSSLTQTLYRVNQTTGAVATVTSTLYGTEIDLAEAVAAASGHGTPTGSVAIADNSTVLGSTALDPTAQAHLFTTTLSVGSHSFTASYSGDASFNPSSTHGASALTVTAAPTFNTLTTSATTIAAGASVTLTATLVGNNSATLGNFGAAPTGTVTFYSGGTTGTLLGTAPISSTATDTNGYLTGSASLTTADLPYSTVGNVADSITAVYSGDANYNGSTSTATHITVTTSAKTATTSTLTATQTTIAYGSSLTVTDTVTSASGTPAGTVKFYVDGVATGNTVTLTNGSAGLLLSTLTGGSHLVTAIYSGSTTYLGSSGALSLTVTPASVALNLIASAYTALQGASIVFTAKIPYTTPAAPTGTIIFSVDGSPTGPGISVASFNTGGVGAYFTDSSLTAGTHTILAAYSGDSNYSAAAANVSVTISAAPYLSLWLAEPGPFAVSSSVPVDARVATLSSGPIPTGSLSYSVDAQSPTTAALTNGYTSFTLPAYKLLKYSLDATYNGDSTYSALTQALQVGQFTQTILFRGLSNITYTAGKTLALTARSTSGLAVTYSVTGPATLTGSSLILTGTGTVTVTASQSGNTTFSAATSVTRSFVSQ